MGEGGGASSDRSCAAAALGSSAASCGPQTRTSRAPTSAVTAATSEALPEPAGPVSSTPVRALAPSRASRSGWENASSSRSRSARAWASRPGRSASRTAGPGAGVVVTGVALPVVVVPPCQPTTVPMLTTAGPGGSTSATCSSTVPRAAPSRSRRARCASRDGARSDCSSDTSSPAVSALPRSAVRSRAGSTAATTAGSPARTTARAACGAARSTCTAAPSGSWRLPSTSSVHSAAPGLPLAGPATTRAAVVRRPRSTTTSSGRTPRAVSTSGCSRTTLSRASRADGCRTAVRDSTPGP